jgi:hypothetical protein
MLVATCQTIAGRRHDGRSRRRRRLASVVQGHANYYAVPTNNRNVVLKNSPEAPIPLNDFRFDPSLFK